MREPALAILAWSIVTNIALISAGLNSLETFSFNILVYAGSAQLAVMPLINGDFPYWTIWLTAFIVNSRFLIFSAAIQPHFKRYSFFQKTIIGYLNTDMTFANFLQKFPSASSDKKSTYELFYFLGLAISNWSIWIVGVVLAISFGAYIPSSWGIGFAGTLALIALIVPTIKNKTALVSAVAAAITCMLTVNFPYRLTIIFSVVSGVLAAMLMDKIQKKRYT
ncbi:AzlC family ABC transporter permease [Polynucleobacter antarcticus]|nr:AzlC family ABC transporter permease [Polynucleobacter antarcticus]